MRVSRVMAAAALVALSFSATARAANLVVNPDFTADITTAWTSSATGAAGSAVWSSSVGSPTAGSAHLTAIASSFALPSTISLTQCVAIAAPNSFDYIVRSFTNSSNGTSNNQARVTFFAGSSCAGTNLGTSEAGTFVLLPDTWLERSLTGTPLPATTVSALVELFADSGTALMDVNFDNVRFGIAGTVPVELQSFSAE
jgi:hypothetical protein